MPHIAVNFYPGRDEETKQEISQKMKAFCEGELGFPEGSISVSIVEIEKGNFPETIREKYDSKDLYVSSRVIQPGEA